MFVTAEMLLGLSMLLVVFGEARARGRRLRVLRAFTESIVLAQQQGGMMEEALQRIAALTRSKAAWFRLIEGGHLVATHAVGVSQDFLREAGIAELTGARVADSGARQAGDGSPRRREPGRCGTAEGGKSAICGDGPGAGEKVADRIAGSGQRAATES